ncbi:MAG: hypothetical protein LBM75_01840 [Myxococcales bacterium]|nr:hypothetical protein [Myxococcales bacterium]
MNSRLNRSAIDEISTMLSSEVVVISCSLDNPL